MFEVKGHKAIIRDFHRVIDNRLVLLSDGENDMLYTGSNKYGNRILAAIVAEDDEQNFLRYFHALVTDKLYYAFLNKQVTLLSILENVESFFVVDFDHNNNEINHAVASLEEIPIEYRPKPDSYCPDFATESSFSYAASMKGKQSDFHKTLPSDLNKVNEYFSEFFKNATAVAHDLRLHRTVYVEALKAGSFQINFRIEIADNAQASLFGIPEDSMKSFLTNFTRYVFNKLPIEQRDIFKGDQVVSGDFKKLEDQLGNMFRQKSIVLPSAGLEQKINRSDSLLYRTIKEY